MNGVVFKDVKKLNKYGYRIFMDTQEENCSILCSKKEVIKICSFNGMGYLKLLFLEEGATVEETLVKWVLIQPTNEKKGMVCLYQKGELTLGRDIS